MKLTSTFFCLFICSLAQASYTLTITSENGYVTTDPAGTSFAEGTKVAMVPRPKPGYCFGSWSGDITSSRIVEDVTMNGNKSVTANFVAWHAPVGIPDPNFGITETYRMYDDPAKRNDANHGGSLTYRENTVEGGYYTHWVNFSTGNDTGNTYGTIANPRKTLPATANRPARLRRRGDGGAL